MYHVGDGRRAQAQLLRDITDAYTLLHVISPVSAVILSVLRREVKGSIGKITGFRKKILVFCGGFAYDMYADRFLICGGGKEEPVLKKLSVCVLFGGVSSEHEVSLRSENLC